MLRRHRKFAIIVLVLACLSFAFLGAGGNYIHDQVHHHSDHSDREQCSWNKLLVQTFVAFICVPAAFKVSFSFRVDRTDQPSLLKSFHILPESRAPPLSV